MEAALYKISATDLEKLDQFEKEYNRIEVEATTENGTKLKAITYIGKADWIDKNLKPPTWYMNYILSQKETFTDDYLHWLRTIETIEQNEDKSLDGKYEGF